MLLYVADAPLLRYDRSNGADVERLSQKVIILTRVGWGLVPHHPNGRDKPCHYAGLRQKNLTEQSLKCGHIRVLRQPRDICRPRNSEVP